MAMVDTVKQPHQVVLFVIGTGLCTDIVAGADVIHKMFGGKKMI